MLLNRPIRTRFRYGSPTRVNLATQRKLAGSFFKRHAVTPTPHKGAAGLRRIVGTRFQVLFHSPPGVLFTFPSRYLSAIGHQGVFRLNGWSRQIHTEFQGFRVTWEKRNTATGLHLRGSHPLRRHFPMDFNFTHGFSLREEPADPSMRSHNPPPATPAGYHTDRVWPHPISLATTLGITIVFSSCRY